MSDEVWKGRACSGLADRESIKAWPGNPNQRVIVGLDADRFAERGWVAIEMPLEPGIARYRHRACAVGTVVGLANRPAQEGRHAENQTERAVCGLYSMVS
jgi:hypothetical protein